MGDAHTLKQTLLKDVEQNALPEFSVLDVGAGSGELLRVAATWARETDRRFKGVGLELNERSAVAIREESARFHEIASIRGNALQLPFAGDEFDYVMCSLFTHHFIDDQVVHILREMSRVARRRIFVIDLHRDPVPYFFYTTLGKLVLKNRLLRHDGALSILRSFKAHELLKLGRAAGLRDVAVEHYFPARLVLTA
jgi:ubiquinone/menaquinone biosynthesis C-methylase UbiE